MIGRTRRRKLLFLNLSAFVVKGGIEGFSRCLLHAMAETASSTGLEPYSYSVYDRRADVNYFAKNRYKYFCGKKIIFTIYTLLNLARFDVFVIGHINLALFGVVCKIVFPKRRLILMAYGIEVWNRQKGLKRLLLKHADEIWAISHFTRQSLWSANDVYAGKIRIFPPTFDPFMPLPQDFGESPADLQRLELPGDALLLYSLTRIDNSERYKGYDLVIAALEQVVRLFPKAVYVLAGRYDGAEYERIQQLIARHGVGDHVILAGLVSDAERDALYRLAKLFVLPSRGEGFGIVFIEALLWGVPVIAGNADGSVDALGGGKWGILVDPRDVNAIAQAMIEVLNKPAPSADERLRRQAEVVAQFGYQRFQRRWKEFIGGEAD